MPRLIQIGNLPDSVRSAELRRMFEVYGQVRTARIATHYHTGQSTGVGCIEMASQSAGDLAIAALNHTENDGRQISVCWSNTAADWSRSSIDI